MDVDYNPENETVSVRGNIKMSSASALTASVDATLKKFKGDTVGGGLITKMAKGVLVFPSIVKVGVLGIGGQYGEGALVTEDTKVIDYYNLVSASFGFQLGAQAYSMIVCFLTDESFQSFRYSQGWKIGVDASVAVIKLGMGAKIDTENIKESVVAFVFDNEGLMYSLTLEGTKISRIAK
jgi:lipid-binding SYLF domain-containing protein